MIHREGAGAGAVLAVDGRFWVVVRSVAARRLIDGVVISATGVACRGRARVANDVNGKAFGHC